MSTRKDVNKINILSAPQSLKRKESPYEFWTVDGSPSIGTFPAGVLAFLAEDTPICLQRGNAEWGSTHMVLRFIPGSAPYLRVLTIYNHQGPLDGQSLGRFAGRPWTGAKPTFALPVPANVAVTVKPKKRVLIKPE